MYFQITFKFLVVSQRRVWLPPGLQHTFRLIEQRRVESPCGKHVALSRAGTKTEHEIQKEILDEKEIHLKTTLSTY